MEVALLVAGASVAGTFVGILAGRGLRRGPPILASPRTAAPEALVPYGERPAKVRRLEASQVSMELPRLALVDHDREVPCPGQTMLQLSQDLQLCRCAQLQSCKQLRSGQLDMKQIREHVAMLSLLGTRLGMDPSLIAALPSAAEGVRCGSPASLHVLGLFERNLRTHEVSLEGRLSVLAQVQQGLPTGLKAVTDQSEAETSGLLHPALPGGSSRSRTHCKRPAPEASDVEDFKCPTLVLTQDVCPSQGSDEEEGNSSTSEAQSSHAGPSPLVEELDEEPEFVNFWENDDVSENQSRKPSGFTKLREEEPLSCRDPCLPASANRSEPQCADDRDKPENSKQVQFSDPSGLMLLALLQHADAKDMSVIKGMKSADIKKVVAHRKKHGPMNQLDELPGIVGRRMSLKKLISDNPV
ncbi:ugtp-1 [Symbiodinium natans]|uniref:Ugtp-1 protein n=1 Tax=Symbiodinium natans TaxID=878477 RepID=A0A812UD75_9DINO|nr:ugtp-1 [Symbiodinium natans]